MKTNEVITEGPLDNIKGAWQGFKTGGLTGAVKGVTAAQAASKFAKDVNAVAKDAYGDWAGVLSTINPSATPDQIKQQLVTWSNQKFKDKVPGVSRVPPPQLQNAKDYASMYKYLQDRSAEYWRARAGQGPETIDGTGIRGPVEPTIPQDDTPPSTTGSAAFGQMAQQLTTPATNQPKTSTTSTGGTMTTTPTGVVHRAAQPTSQSGANPPATPQAAAVPGTSARVDSRVVNQVKTDLRQLLSQGQIKGLAQYLLPYVQQTQSTVRSTGVQQIDAFLNVVGIKTK